MNKTILEAKVEARNIVNAEANRLAPILIANFAPHVGTKVLKVGGLMEKLKGLVPEPSKGIQLFRHISDYCLAYTVKTSVGCGDCGCTYDEVTVYVGDVRDMVLTKLCEVPAPARTNYTVAEVLKLRENLESAKAAFSDAEAAVYPFGSYDR